MIFPVVEREAPVLRLIFGEGIRFEDFPPGGAPLERAEVEDLGILPDVGTVDASPTGTSPISARAFAFSAWAQHVHAIG